MSTAAVTERRRSSLWGLLVTVSACLLVAVAVALGVWWAVSSHRRVASYDVRGSVHTVSLDLGEADVLVLGGAETSSVGVQRTDRFAFGHDATATRSVTGGLLRLRSRCPEMVIGTCAAAYRVTVPSNVAVTVRTTSGDVRFQGYRGSARITTEDGNVAVTGYCGFGLQVRSDAGDVRATAACTPERLTLRTGSGDAQAVVPPGRYAIDASSTTGSTRVRGLQSADDAPFSIQVATGSGVASVEAAAP